MTVNDYLRVFRKRWRLIAVFVLGCIGAAALLVWHATPKYQASTQLFVAAKDTSEVGTLEAGGQFVQERVQSYADIIDSPQITGPVAQQVGGGLTSQEVSDEVAASAPLNTVLVNVHVTDTSPQRAQVLANAVSNEFATYAAQLETTDGSRNSPVKVTVVKEARLPTHPVSPKTTLDLLIGLIVGLGLGLAGAIFRESTDTSIRTSADIQAVCGASTLGVIGFDNDAETHPLVVAQGAHSTRSESFRALRTNLQFIDVDSAPRSIVFTSSVPDEGKTTTACNLAISLAQGGKKVLLIEADLRRPRAARYLGLPDSVGLTNVLVGTVSPEDASQQWGNIPLHVLPSGPPPPNPSELLASKGMAALLNRVEAKYDIVLLDAPPLLPVTDAAVIATQASGAVLIVRSGKTNRDQLHRSVEALESVNARLLGCVINMAPTRGPDAYHYDYSYSYTDGPTRPAREESARKRDIEASALARKATPSSGTPAASTVAPRSRRSAPARPAARPAPTTPPATAPAPARPASAPEGTASPAQPAPFAAAPPVTEAAPGSPSQPSSFVKRVPGPPVNGDHGNGDHPTGTGDHHEDATEPSFGSNS